MRVEGVGYDVGGHQKKKKNKNMLQESRSKNSIFYIFFELRVVGKHGGKDIGDAGMGPKITLKQCGALESTS